MDYGVIGNVSDSDSEVIGSNPVSPAMGYRISVVHRTLTPIGQVRFLLSQPYGGSSS